MPNSFFFDLLYIEPGQSGQEVVANEFLRALDAVVGLEILEFDKNDPPSSPSDGDAYKIGDSPTGAWASNANDIAVYFTGWVYISTKTGLILYDSQVSTIRICTDAANDSWSIVGTQASDTGEMTALDSVSGTGDDATINGNNTTIRDEINDIRTALRNANLMS